MTVQTMAVFENGHLTLLGPLCGILDHSVVRITIDTASFPGIEQQLQLLSETPVDPELADAIEEGRRRPWTVEEF